jgi:hypothetical protein
VFEEPVPAPLAARMPAGASAVVPVAAEELGNFSLYRSPRMGLFQSNSRATKEI